MRFRGAGDTNSLGPEFVHAEQENLRRWRGLQSEQSETLVRPGLTDGRSNESAAVGGTQEPNDDVDDATESMKGLRFLDMDIDDNGFAQGRPHSTSAAAAGRSAQSVRRSTTTSKAGSSPTIKCVRRIAHAQENRAGRRCAA